MPSVRTHMREQNAAVRGHNFSEVALGYSKDEALLEAKRCLNCKNKPCASGCPVGVDIPAFISAIKNGDDARAIRIIRETNALPAICGRVCPQEDQCECKCVLNKAGAAIAIGRLERYAADCALSMDNQAQDAPASNGIPVAVVGAGPAGLTCAGELRRRGYDVTVFEALHTLGGVLAYGIPEFRLPKALVAKETALLSDMGVKFELNAVIGRTLTIDELEGSSGFRAIFIGSGAGLPKFMDMPGEDLNGVYSANEFLTRVNLMKAYSKDSHTPIQRAKHTIIIGGGNVAMDAARCALRLGAEATILYRRTLKEMPARQEEVHHALEEGVRVIELSAPTEIFGDETGWVKGVMAVDMQLGEPDASGRKSPAEIPDSRHELRCDQVIIAIGTSPNPLISRTTPGLAVNRHGCLVVHEYVRTTRAGVFAGGDAVTGAATVILAMGAGREAAQRIDEGLKRDT